MKVLHAVPASIDVDIGDDMVLLGPGDELDWDPAVFAHRVVARFYGADNGPADSHERDHMAHICFIGPPGPEPEGGQPHEAQGGGQGAGQGRFRGWLP